MSTSPGADARTAKIPVNPHETAASAAAPRPIEWRAEPILIRSLDIHDALAERTASNNDTYS